MLLLGSANHPPDNIIFLLKKKLKVTSESIEVVNPSDTITVKPKAKYYIFLDVPTARLNLEKINSKKYANTIGIVCADVIGLYKFKGITALDYHEANDPHLDGFILNDSIDMDICNSEGRTVEYDPTRMYENRIVERVQSLVGILTQFMTFIYSTPSATHQTPLKELACAWLVSDDDVSDLHKKLATLLDTIKLSDRKRTRYIELLTTEYADLYRRVLKLVKNIDVHSPEFSKIVADYGVSAYEIRYILAIYNKVKK